jgi:hypothetical protein
MDLGKPLCRYNSTQIHAHENIDSLGYDQSMYLPRAFEINLMMVLFQ